jgi:hypothetical protein
MDAGEADGIGPRRVGKNSAINTGGVRREREGEGERESVPKLRNFSNGLKIAAQKTTKQLIIVSNCVSYR